MMSRYAQQEGSLQVALEHRFYGQSRPFPDLSTDNLNFLSSEQALADVSTFLSYIRTQYPKITDVISFGGSYSGALAAWFRLKYPHITLGSVASSAPVLAVLDMISYLNVVDQSIDRLSGLNCEKNIQKATNQIQDAISTVKGRSYLSALFQTCTNLTSDWKDIATFMSTLMGNWMGTVQYNRENPFSPTVKDLCTTMLQNSTPLQSYAQISKFFLALNQQTCLDFKYSTQVEQLTNVTYPGPGVGIRSWTWQTCQEFGYFQSTDSKNQPFGNLVPLKYFTQLCSDVFGVNNAIPRVNETNIHYGGLNPQSSYVLFVNGDIDPWHSLSILNSSHFNPTILIEGTAHCADMIPARPSDPPGLEKAQKRISQIIHEWLVQNKTQKFIKTIESGMY